LGVTVGVLRQYLHEFIDLFIEQNVYIPLRLNSATTSKADNESLLKTLQMFLADSIADGD